MNPAPACYMNSVATGLVWCASEAGGWSEDQWSSFLEDFATIDVMPPGGEPLLLWFAGQCTTFLSNWLAPFRQHDVTDFAHHLLQLLHPKSLFCEFRVVVQSALRCPWHPNICSDQIGSLLPTDASD